MTDGVAVLPHDESLARFRPKESLQQIAALEGVEIYAARAKDSAMLSEAVTQKLTAQREFVLWWDGEERRGRPGKTSQASNVFLKDLGVGATRTSAPERFRLTTCLPGVNYAWRGLR